MLGNQTNYRTLNQVANNPAVKLILREEENGFCVYLNEGWLLDGHTSIQRNSVNEIIEEVKRVEFKPNLNKGEKMKTVTVKFLVSDACKAGVLINEIAESICNRSGYPFIVTSIQDSTEDEIKEINYL